MTRYLGIPFAQPPVGALRFAPPQAIAYNASATINATANGPACPQPPSSRYGNSSEDCLHLNVYTPSARALNALNQTATILAGNNTSLTGAYANGLPVMVWIYGGVYKIKPLSCHYLVDTTVSSLQVVSHRDQPCHTTDQPLSPSLSPLTPPSSWLPSIIVLGPGVGWEDPKLRQLERAC